MKNGIILSITLILLASILIVSSHMEIPSENDIYGVWEGEGNEMELVFTFNTDGTCSLSFKNIATGEMNELSGTFEVDFAKSPTPLSIRNIPQLNHPLHTIMEFTNNGSLIIADFSPVWRLRPISINYDTSMNLRRVEGD